MKIQDALKNSAVTQREAVFTEKLYVIWKEDKRNEV